MSQASSNLDVPSGTIDILDQPLGNLPGAYGAPPNGIPAGDTNPILDANAWSGWNAAPAAVPPINGTSAYETLPISGNPEQVWGSRHDSAALPTSAFPFSNPTMGNVPTPNLGAKIKIMPQLWTGARMPDSVFPHRLLTGNDQQLAPRTFDTSITGYTDWCEQAGGEGGEGGEAAA
eukprot:TRINITY_DN51499_c0_g1_i1.p1 TRINITY_DN51499_c0_g1~~TRINITY_DN51499_c0_g1_i1.p1  ORF type:complete len:176 (-),score=17.11 TRINITY_DN51499_c0_g1_i1:701-1228(-)